MLAIVLLSCMAVSGNDSPVTVDIRGGNGYASFTNRLHPGNRIGYRFHEHVPMIWGEVPENPPDAGIEPDIAVRPSAADVTDGVDAEMRAIREAIAAMGSAPARRRER